jgi:hypothetical protein
VPLFYDVLFARPGVGPTSCGAFATAVDPLTSSDCTNQSNDCVVTCPICAATEPRDVAVQFIDDNNRRSNVSCATPLF